MYPTIGKEDSLSRALNNDLDAKIRPHYSESVLLRAESLSNDDSASKIDRFWAECLDSGYNSESDSIWIRGSKRTSSGLSSEAITLPAADSGSGQTALSTMILPAITSGSGLKA